MMSVHYAPEPNNLVACRAILATRNVSRFTTTKQRDVSCHNCRVAMGLAQPIVPKPRPLPIDQHVECSEEIADRTEATRTAAEKLTARLEEWIDAKIDLTICEHVHKNAGPQDWLRVDEAYTQFRDELAELLEELRSTGGSPAGDGAGPVSSAVEEGLTGEEIVALSWVAETLLQGRRC